MKIGIVGKKMGENSFGCTLPYLEYFRNFSEEISILMPNEFREDLDLLVLPGGLDVSTTRYSASLPSFYNTNHDASLEHFDKYMLPMYIYNNTPIVGICRGFQSLAVHFGGVLSQNISHPYSEKGRDELVHGVEFTEKIKELGLKIEKKHKVNSLHHQGIYNSEMPQVLHAIMLCDEDEYGDRIVEAFVHESQPIIGFQYHPEETYDYYAYKMIGQLLYDRKLAKETENAIKENEDEERG